MHAPVIRPWPQKVMRTNHGNSITAIHVFVPIYDCPFPLLRKHHAGFRSVEAENQNKTRHVFFEHRHLKADVSLPLDSALPLTRTISLPEVPTLLTNSTEISNMAEQAYFSRFQTFAPNPDATLIENFQRLAISKNWGKKSKKFKEERKSYMLALADTHLGSIDRGGTAERLVALQELCEELGVKPVPSSINQCKKVCYKCYGCVWWRY